MSKRGERHREDVLRAHLVVGGQRGKHLDRGVLARLQRIEQITLGMTQCLNGYLHFFTNRVAVVKRCSVVHNPHSTAQSSNARHTAAHRIYPRTPPFPPSVSRPARESSTLHAQHSVNFIAVHNLLVAIHDGDVLLLKELVLNTLRLHAIYGISYFDVCV